MATRCLFVGKKIFRPKIKRKDAATVVFYETPEMKQLRESWQEEAMKRGFFGTSDLISRKAAHDNLGETELFAYLTDDDIREHGLHVDEDGEFYFTEEQGRMASAMYVLMRRYIADLPSAHSRPIVEQLLKDDVLFTAEAAEILDISPQAVHSLVYRKKLTPIRSAAGGQLFYKADVENLKTAKLQNKATEIAGDEQAPARWILKDGRGHGVCSKCHHQDGIDPLATHCRYCGAPIRPADYPFPVSPDPSTQQS